MTRTGALRLADAGGFVGYLGILAAAHVVLVIAGRRVDEILLPTMGLLGGIGLLLMERLPQTLVQQDLGPVTLGLGSLQIRRAMGHGADMPVGDPLLVKGLEWRL